jgi:hypothetical protein
MPSPPQLKKAIDLCQDSSVSYPQGTREAFAVNFGRNGDSLQKTSKSRTAEQHINLA